MLDPASARPRPDLAFLTVRSARRAAPPVTAPLAPPVVASPVFAPLAPPLAAPLAPPAAPPAALSLSGSSLLDLDAAEEQPSPPAPVGFPAAAPSAVPAAVRMLDLASGAGSSAAVTAVRPLGPRVPDSGRVQLTPAA